MTKIGLIDVCINGDEGKFGSLFGGMFDHFSCLFNLLKDNGIKEMPEKVDYSQNAQVAEFIFPSKMSLPNTAKCTQIHGCRVNTVVSEQTTKVQIER